MIRGDWVKRKDGFVYLLRLNSKTDDNGDIVEANYGKIAGGIVFDPRASGKGVCYIELIIYYNQTLNGRNLEFDPARNLSTGLKLLEKVARFCPGKYL